jgi:hypothetical protein
MPADKVNLDPSTRRRLVDTKITCPFLGSAVNRDILSVLGDVDNPLANIEDVRELGNRGGGDLGDLLVLFAEGNHALMRGWSGIALDVPVPLGLFSLELPGSQGSHPGHSGILEDDPRKLDSGRLRIENFDRLTALSKDGLIKRSSVGCFIAENLKRDEASNVVGATVESLLIEDLDALVESAGAVLIGALVHFEKDAETARIFEERITKLLGEDNLVGSSGEFGLLFAFLRSSPRTQELDGEPALSLEDVRAMFLDGHLPSGWELWKKSRADWLVHTASLVVSAGGEYRKASVASI